MSKITKQHVFNYLDQYGCGKINKKLLPQALRYLGVIKTKTELDFLVQNLNDEISFADFSEIVDEQQKTSLSKDQLMDAFEAFDPNKTGKCNANDLFHSLKVVGEKLTEEDIQYIKSKVIIDKNGNIDYESFIETLTK